MRKNIPLLSISFRPFFILAALLAVLGPFLWVCIYSGHISLPLNNVEPLFWHGHEMLFGFSGALIAGFILTASANWTSSAPYQGRYLLLLILLWLMERFSYFLPLHVNVSFVLMNLFFPTLVVMLFYKLRNFPKQKYVFIPILLVLTSGKFLHSWGHLFTNEQFEYFGKHIGSGLIRLIMLLIAGRVLPFFSRKRIKGLEINVPNWVNFMSLIPVAILIIPFPEVMPKEIRAVIYLWAILSNTIRQGMWQPHRAFKIPIIFVLHVGVMFITWGLFQELLGLYYEQVQFSQAPLHMLLVGGLGVIGVGIMTRVSLGHTGRVIKADKWIQLIYLCITFGAIIRVGGPLFFPELYFKSLYLSAALWTLGFVVFLLRFVGVLASARPDGKE